MSIRVITERKMYTNTNLYICALGIIKRENYFNYFNHSVIDIKIAWLYIISNYYEQYFKKLTFSQKSYRIVVW